MHILLLAFLLLVGLLVVQFLMSFLPAWRAVNAIGTSSPGAGFFLRKDRSLLYNSLTQFGLTQLSGLYHVWLGPRVFVLTSDPDCAQTILMAREGIEKGLMSTSTPRSMESWNKNNIVAVDGEVWQRQRRVFAPAFGSEAYKSYFPTFKRMTNKAIDLLYKEATNQSGDVDTQSYMFKFALDVLGESIFHYDFQSLSGGGTEHYLAYDNILMTPRNFWWRFFGRYLELFPLESAKKYKASQKTMKELFIRMMEERKAKNKDQQVKADILDYVLQAIEESSLSDEEVFANFWIFFIAGHDTTATALTWELQALIHFPEEQERIYDEITEIVGKREIEWEDLKKFKLLSNFINEALRMFPPVGLLPTRKTTKPLVLNNTTVPAGVTIGIDIRTLHRNPKHWVNPDKFDPDRWFPERMKAERHHRFAYLPFSLGKRECLGNNFSLQEQILFLATLLQNYKLTKPQHHSLSDLRKQTSASIFNAPEHGWISISPRN